MHGITCTFNCPGILSAESVECLELEGREEMNAPSQWHLKLRPRNPSAEPIAIAALLDQPCAFQLQREGKTALTRHGYVDRAAEEILEDGTRGLGIRMCPRVQRLALLREHHMYLGKSVQQVLEELLVRCGLIAPEDRIFKWKNDSPRREFTWQFEESALEFMARLCEEEGISWFVEHGKERDCLVFTDDTSSLAQANHIIPLLGPGQAALRPTDGSPYFSGFMQSLDSTAAKIHYLGTHLPDPKAAPEAWWDLRSGEGVHVVQGERCASPEEALRKSHLRMEALDCRRIQVTGQGWVPLGPGESFALGGREAPPFSRTLTEEAKQATEEKSSSEGPRPAKRPRGQGAGGAGPQAGQASGRASRGVGSPELPTTYLITCLTLSLPFKEAAPPAAPVELQAIPRVLPFRPMFRQGAGKLRGPILAKVDGPAEGQLATMDAQGRYKVVFPKELSGQASQCSAWLPLLQPYGGRGHGLHLPLRKDVDVLLVGHQGNHEDLMILGVLPTQSNPSVMSDILQQQALVQTPGNNVLRFTDAPGLESLSATSKGASGLVLTGVGASLTWALGGAVSFSGLGRAELVGGFSTTLVAGQRTESTQGNLLQVNTGSFVRSGHGAWTEVQIQGERVRIGRDHNLEWDGQRSVMASQDLDLSVLPYACGTEVLEGQHLDELAGVARDAADNALKQMDPKAMSSRLTDLALEAGRGTMPFLDGASLGKELEGRARKALKDLASRAAQPRPPAHGGGMPGQPPPAAPPSPKPMGGAQGAPPPAAGPGLGSEQDLLARAQATRRMLLGGPLPPPPAAPPHAPGPPPPNLAALMLQGPLPDDELDDSPGPSSSLFVPPDPPPMELAGPPAPAPGPGGAPRPSPTGRYRPIGTLRMNNQGKVDLLGTWITLRARSPREFGPAAPIPGAPPGESPGVRISAAGPIILGNSSQAPPAAGQDETTLLQREMAQEPTPRIELRSRQTVQVDTERFELAGREILLGIPAAKPGQPLPCVSLTLQAEQVSARGEAIQLSSRQDTASDSGGDFQVKAAGNIALSAAKDFEAAGHNSRVKAVDTLALEGKKVLLNGTVLMG